MRRWLPFLLAAALTACGGSEGNNLTVDEIERLSTPDNGVEPPAAPPRLTPLGETSLAAMGAMAASCRFETPAGTLLVAGGDTAAAMIDGALRQLVATAPAAPTGGFFEDRNIGISVGRTAEGDRLTVTNRRTETQEEIAGTWLCAQPTP